MRVLGELRKLGFHISLQTVRRYRKDVPRDPWSSWRAFLANHRPKIWASDFFTVHTLWFETLYVFFFIAHDRRTVMHVNVTAHPRAEWVWRQLINATFWGSGPRYLIRDRDRSYGGDFVARARGIGIKTVLTPIATPQANGIAERLIGTLRRECFDHVIIVNERHLRNVLREFVEHHNEARPHQALELRVPHEQPRARPAASGRIVSRPVLGGLTHEYDRPISITSRGAGISRPRRRKARETVRDWRPRADSNRMNANRARYTA
ncbi:MAG: integrase core domain-containing protein [Chloroflexi bacterium]|nr:integrase core domain-containing protein [Chloroflexota bacterium]